MKAAVQAINGVWHWQRSPYHVFRCNSPLGHTIHYMEKGSYELTLLGRRHTVRQGDLVLYGSIENHAWRGDGTETSFYSINFLPLDLTAPQADRRLISTDGSPGAWFAQAWESFRDTTDPAHSSRCFSALYQILAFLGSQGLAETVDETRNLWRDLERVVVKKRLYRAKVHELAHLGGYNETTVYRSCVENHGVSPLVRLRQIRMEEARNLLLHSTLPISSIARELGYPRVHEFSREFSKSEAQAPLAFRRLHTTGKIGLDSGSPMD